MKFFLMKKYIYIIHVSQPAFHVSTQTGRSRGFAFVYFKEVDSAVEVTCYIKFFSCIYLLYLFISLFIVFIYLFDHT